MTNEIECIPDAQRARRQDFEFQAGRTNASDERSGKDASSPLGRLRLLIALDCLLVEGSVGKAAVRMGLSAPAMSRILS